MIRTVGIMTIVAAGAGFCVAASALCVAAKEGAGAVVAGAAAGYCIAMTIAFAIKFANELSAKA